jgi:hypothetical protein
MNMKDNKQIQVGDNVSVIVQVWREDETPTQASFYSGKITEIFERSRHALYVRVKGLDKLIPLDRVRLA